MAHGFHGFGPEVVFGNVEIGESRRICDLDARECPVGRTVLRSGKRKLLCWFAEQREFRDQVSSVDSGTVSKLMPAGAN